MSLVRYGTNVFELDDVYGLDLYVSDDVYTLRVVINRGTDSFKIKFDSKPDAERAFETLCEELEVRDLTPRNRTETSAAE